MVAGPAQVDASSLQIIRPGAKYSLVACKACLEVNGLRGHDLQ